MPINNGMTIDELGSVSSITANDEIPVWDAEAAPGEPTKKITGNSLASSVKNLGGLLGTSDVVNNLTSTATDKPLSANMGKTLSDKTLSKVSYSTAFDVSVASGCHFYCDRVGRTIFIDIVINFTSAVAINTQIAHIDGIAHILESHASAIGSNGTGARFLLQPSGALKVERALQANEWFSCSFAVMYNTEV